MKRPTGDHCHAIRRELERLLDERFGIDHTTLQVDQNREGQLITIEAGSPGPVGHVDVDV